MKGLLFALITPDPLIKGRINIKTGVVKSAVGADRFLLEFEGNNFRWSNVFSSEQLERFAFFLTKPEQQAFIAEIIGQHTVSPPAPVIEEDHPPTTQ
jgi:hypothetical protein